MVVTLDLNHKVFIVYIIVFNISFDLGVKIHFLKKAQIAYLKIDETPTKVLNKYANFVEIFSLKLIIKLPKYISINDYIIKLIDD